MARPRKPKTPFHRFDRSQEVIRLVVLMYTRFPLSPRNVEALLFERGIDISYEMVQLLVEPLRPDVRRRDLSKRRAGWGPHSYRRRFRRCAWRTQDGRAKAARASEGRSVVGRRDAEWAD